MKNLFVKDEMPATEEDKGLLESFLRMNKLGYTYFPESGGFVTVKDHIHVHVSALHEGRVRVWAQVSPKICEEDRFDAIGLALHYQCWEGPLTPSICVKDNVLYVYQEDELPGADELEGALLIHLMVSALASYAARCIAGFSSLCCGEGLTAIIRRESHPEHGDAAREFQGIENTLSGACETAGGGGVAAPDIVAAQGAPCPSVSWKATETTAVSCSQAPYQACKVPLLPDARGIHSGMANIGGSYTVDLMVLGSKSRLDVRFASELGDLADLVEVETRMRLVAWYVLEGGDERFGHVGVDWDGTITYACVLDHIPSLEEVDQYVDEACQAFSQRGVDLHNARYVWDTLEGVDCVFERPLIEVPPVPSAWPSFDLPVSVFEEDD